MLVGSFAGPAPGGQRSNARKGGTLRLGSTGDLDFADPALGYFAHSWAVQFATCARLFTAPDLPGAKGARVVPEVVDGFTVSRDRKTYTFELKKTFRFSSGGRVTAANFVHAVNRVASPVMNSQGAPFIGDIVGAAAALDGRAKTISGVEALGPYRLRIRLKRALGDFIYRLSMPFFCPVPTTTPVAATGVDILPGSGPYYMAKRVLNRQFVLMRNPYYRGDRPANVDQVVYTVMGRDACRAAVEDDRMDYCFFAAFSTDLSRQLTAKYGINRGRYFFTPQLGITGLAFNHDRPAFKGRGQIALKKAINYAIDRPALARAFGHLGAKRTDQLLPPAVARDVSIYPLKGADPATARNWLARARYQPTRLVLYAGGGPRGVELAQVLTLSLRQIGIELDVQYFGGGTFPLDAGVEKRGQPNDLAVWGWDLDYLDGAAFFETQVNGERLGIEGNSNIAYFDNPIVNARIRAIEGLSGAARARAWADLDVWVMRNDPPWAPFVNGARRELISPSFGCFIRHPLYQPDIAAACKK